MYTRQVTTGKQERMEIHSVLLQYLLTSYARTSH